MADISSLLIKIQSRTHLKLKLSTNALYVSNVNYKVTNLRLISAKNAKNGPPNAQAAVKMVTEMRLKGSISLSVTKS